MNIAICLSGSPRDIDRAADTIKKISKTGDVKVFAHLWHYKTLPSYLATNNSQAKAKCYKPNEVFELFNTKEINFNKIVVEKFEDCQNILKKQFEEGVLRFDMSRGSPIYMFYSNNQSGNLKTAYETHHNIQFDIVYRIRSDSKLENEEELPTKLIEPGIYIPNVNHYGGYNDQFAYGTSKSMTTYFNLHTNVCVDKKNVQTKDVKPNPEGLLKLYLEEQNERVFFTNLNVKIHNH